MSNDDDLGQHVPMGNAMTILFRTQALQSARLLQIQEMIEEIYAEVKNEDIEELRKKIDKANHEDYRDNIRSMFKDAGMSDEKLDKIFEHTNEEE